MLDLCSTIPAKWTPYSQIDRDKARMVLNISKALAFYCTVMHITYIRYHTRTLTQNTSQWARKASAFEWFQLKTPKFLKSPFIDIDLSKIQFFAKKLSFAHLSNLVPCADIQSDSSWNRQIWHHGLENSARSWKYFKSSTYNMEIVSANVFTRKRKHKVGKLLIFALPMTAWKPPFRSLSNLLTPASQHNLVFASHLAVISFFLAVCKQLFPQIKHYKLYSCLCCKLRSPQLSPKYRQSVVWQLEREGLVSLRLPRFMQEITYYSTSFYLSLEFKF